MLWLFTFIWIGLTIEEVLLLTLTHFTWSWINIFNAVWILVLLPMEAVWIRYVSCKRRLRELIKEWGVYLTKHTMSKLEYKVFTTQPEIVHKVNTLELPDGDIRKATWCMVFWLDPKRIFPENLRLQLMGPDKWNHVEPWRRSEVSEALFKARHKTIPLLWPEALWRDSHRLFGDWYGIN